VYFLEGLKRSCSLLSWMKLESRGINFSAILLMSMFTFGVAEHVS